MQTIENLLKKGQDHYKALLNYRITPLDGIGLSPAKILIGHSLKTSLPTNSELLKPWRNQEIKQHLQNTKKGQNVYYDKHCSKELPHLASGNKVSLKHDNKWVQATVIEKHHTPRSYIVQTPEGKKYRTNLRHLNESRVSQALNNKPVKNSQDSQASSPTCNLTNLHGRFREAKTQSEHSLNPAIRSRSGRQVKQQNKGWNKECSCDGNLH